jgi:hypothetical protein
MNENQSFDFLKIVGHGYIIPRPYLPILSSKKREDRTVFCLGKCFFSKWQKNQDFKSFQLPSFFKYLNFLEFRQILS